MRIGVLPETVWQGRYHREQRGDGDDRDTAP
jgi:lambda repressor-like predicted transcriptional regulator